MNQQQKEVQQAFLNNEKEVLAALKKNYEDALLEINSNLNYLMARQDADMQHVIYQAEYQKALKDQVEGVLNQLNNNEFETVSEYLTQCYEEGFVGTMYDLQAQGIPLVFPIDQKKVVQAIQHDTKLSSTLYAAFDMKDLKKKISSEISRGISNAATYNEIARNISGHADINLNKAMRIARTEGHRINIKSAMDAQQKAREKGADIVKQWDASLDGKTRPHHRELDGQIRELDEDFEYSGGTVSAPAHFGDPSEDCNCRCALLQRARWALGEDITKYSPDAVEEISDDGATKLEKIKAKDYDEFKKKYMSEAEKLAYEKKASERVKAAEQKMKTFVPAKTIEEAEEYAKRFAETISYANIEDIEFANIINKTLTNLFDKYPIKKLRILQTSDSIGAAAARANYELLEISTSFLNGKLKARDNERSKRVNQRGIVKYTEMLANEKDESKREKYEKIIRELEKENKFIRFDISGDYSGLEQVESTMIHEYGHIIADQFIGQISRKEANSKFEFESNNELNMMCHKVAGALYNARKTGDIYNLSMYAEQDEFEFFAEMFTMYHKGMELPDYIVNVIEGVLSFGTV